MMPLRMLGLLMLMLLQCDADPCPDGLLTVTSSEVIAEFGSVILLNCSNINENHSGMLWRIGNTTSKREEDEPFVEFNLTLSDWNLRPQCEIGLDESTTCTTDLEITVYKKPDYITVFPTNYASTVEGQQYQLQCDITDVAPVQNLKVKWYKENETIHEEHFTKTIKNPQSESHILTVNISRKDNGVTFMCEAQLDFGPDGPNPPALNKTHNVSVHYAPFLTSGPPQVFYEEQDGNVTLNCDAEGHPPPNFRWVYNGVNMTEETDSLFVNQVSSNSIYTCTATNALGRITKEFHFKVTKISTTTPAEAMAMPEESLPKDCPLTLSPAELVVKLGDPSSVNCSTTVANPARLGWETEKGGTGEGNITTITWTVEKAEIWNTAPMCFITTNDNEQCNVSLAMTIYNTPKIITDFPRDPVEEGEESLLKCDFINVAPVQNLAVKWYRGNEIMKTQMFDDDSVKPVDASSNLTVLHERGDNGKKFSCRAELHLGPNGPNPVPTVISEPYIADVNYIPRAPSCPQYIGVEHNITLDMAPCVADGNPPPKVQWYHQGELVNSSQPLTRSDSGNYKLEFSNYLGKIYTYVDVTVQYGPSFSCNNLYEVKENDKFQTRCEPAGNPVPTVTWFRDGKKVHQQNWRRHDSGKYVLKATNKYGTANHEVQVDVMYAPELKYGDSTNLMFTAGDNVTLNCSAEGKPAPTLQWNCTRARNVEETTRGSLQTVRITGATFDNAGVYICVATNKIGSVSREVTLTMKGETSALQWNFPWWLLLIPVVIIIIILIILYNNCQKKHGQYNFVPNKGNDIPMSTTSNGIRA